LLPLFSQLIIQRDFFAERLRKKSRRHVRRQELCTTGLPNHSAGTSNVYKGKMPQIQVAAIPQQIKSSMKFLPRKHQKKVSNTFADENFLPLDTQLPPLISATFTREGCRNFKSLPLFRKLIFQRNFFTARLRKKVGNTLPVTNFAPLDTKPSPPVPPHLLE
jgi:hypothetical protein